jgi:hypothetical protein
MSLLCSFVALAYQVQDSGTDAVKLAYGAAAIDAVDSFGWLGRAAHAARINLTLLRWAIRPTIYSYAYPTA